MAFDPPMMPMAAFSFIMLPRTCKLHYPERRPCSDAPLSDSRRPPTLDHTLIVADKVSWFFSLFYSSPPPPPPPPPTLSVTDKYSIMVGHIGLLYRQITDEFYQ